MQEQGDRKQLQIQALELVPAPACVLGNNGDIIHLNAALRVVQGQAGFVTGGFDAKNNHEGAK